MADTFRELAVQVSVRMRGRDWPALQSAVLCSLLELKSLAKPCDSSRQSSSLKRCWGDRCLYMPCSDSARGSPSSLISRPSLWMETQTRRRYNLGIASVFCKVFCFNFEMHLHSAGFQLFIFQKKKTALKWKWRRTAIPEQQPCSQRPPSCWWMGRRQCCLWSEWAPAAPHTLWGALQTASGQTHLQHTAHDS